MKNILFTQLFFFLAVTISPAAASNCGKMPVMSTTVPGRGKIELLLDSDLVEKTPSWTPGAGEPPLSIVQAIEKATAWGSEHYKKFDAVELRQISLTNLGCAGAAKHWYYIVEFIPSMGGNRMYGAGNWAAVLMDGSIVGPTETTN